MMSKARVEPVHIINYAGGGEVASSRKKTDLRPGTRMTKAIGGLCAGLQDHAGDSPRLIGSGNGGWQVSEPRSIDQLNRALELPATVKFLVAHGGMWGTPGWKLARSSDALPKFRIELTNISQAGIQSPSKIFVVAACDADTATEQWQAIAGSADLLVLGRREVLTGDQVRWATALICELSRIHGQKEIGKPECDSVWKQVKAIIKRDVKIQTRRRVQRAGSSSSNVALPGDWVRVRSAGNMQVAEPIDS